MKLEQITEARNPKQRIMDDLQHAHGETWLGNLELTTAKIKTLPDEFTVEGHLDLTGSSIVRLPSKLTVGDSLLLSHTNVKEIPEDLKVGNSIYLTDTPVTKFPLQQVHGDLKLSKSSIEDLPEGLYTFKRLDLTDTMSLKELPANVRVGADLRLTRSNVERIGPNLKVKGTAYLNNMPNLREIGPGITANSISLGQTPIKQLPDNMEVNYELDLSWTKITELPKGLVVGILNIRHTEIAEIPQGTKITDTLLIECGSASNFLAHTALQSTIKDVNARWEDNEVEKKFDSLFNMIHEKKIRPAQARADFVEFLYDNNFDEAYLE